MARSKDADVSVLVENWFGVHYQQDKHQWEAWTQWRREQLGVVSRPDNLTVPTPFPPATVAEAREYIAIVQQVRSSIGWKEARAKLRTDIVAYGASGRR